MNCDILFLPYFDYPLEQGLRQDRHAFCGLWVRKYFDYPLEQGLRHIIVIFPSHSFGILIIH